MATIGFAHRGARAHAPENTIPAFALALEMGARGLESDVWLTGDGVAVLDHDGVVDGRPVAELERRDLPGHIPELAELYRECGSGFELSLDLKDDAAAPEVLRVAGAADSLDRLWLCHWNWRRLLPCREQSRRVRLVDSTSTTHMSTPGPQRARRMAALGIDALNLHHSHWSPELLGAMQRADRRAFAWDLQTGAELRSALATGFDGIYSDHVDRMQEALSQAIRD
ncbi:MAG: glycerophosphodiester phosphodiesterase [Myxococcota bacterium]